jgi:8-oxo-dGTP diphosphatase
MRTSIWVAVVCPSTQRVLLARRAQTTRNAGQWNFFGGGLDDGERPTKAAIRELKEEAGIDAVKADLIALGEAATATKLNILFGLVVEEEFAPVLNGESTHWEWVKVAVLGTRRDLHLSTAMLTGCLSGWMAVFPRPRFVVDFGDECDEFDVGEPDDLTAGLP